MRFIIIALGFLIEALLENLSKTILNPDFLNTLPMPKLQFAFSNTYTTQKQRKIFQMTWILLLCRLKKNTKSFYPENQKDFDDFELYWGHVPVYPFAIRHIRNLKGIQEKCGFKNFRDFSD